MGNRVRSISSSCCKAKVRSLNKGVLGFSAPTEGLAGTIIYIIGVLVIVMPDPKRQYELTDRRSFIEKIGLLGGTGALAGLAGCAGNGTDGNGNGDTGNGNGNTGNGSDGNGNGDSGGQEHSLLLGSVYPSGHVINEMAIGWADSIREETGGRIDITIEEGFGGEQEVLEQTSIGAIEGTLIGAMWVIQHAPSRYWVESPFVFDSWEQQRRAYMGEFLDEGRENLQSDGNQRIVGPPVYRGFRHTTGNEGFPTPDEIQGVNIRIPELDPWLQIWDGIGAAPTTVAFDELYSALQQGVVEAQENPAQTINSFSLFEVQSHVTLTSHLASTGWFTFNEDTWTSMSSDDQQLLEESLSSSIEQLSADIEDSESEALDALEENGMEIVEADPDAWLSAAEEPLQQLFEDEFEPSLEEVRNI